MLNRLLGILAVAVVLIAALLYSQKRTGPLRVSGLIESYEIRVGSRVGGRVHRVLAEEGERVRKGGVLVELEPFQLLEQKTQAAAQLAEARAEFDRLFEGYRTEEKLQAKAHHDQLAATLAKLVKGPRDEDIAAAKSQLDLAQSQLELATLKYRRTEMLFGKQVATQEDLDQATTELRVSRATVQARKEELAKLERGTRDEELAEARAQLEEANQAWQLRENGYRPQEKAQAKAAVEAAEAALRAIERQIDELTIQAPLDGVVEAVDLQPGDLVGANSPVLSLMDTSRLWVRAYLPENHLNVQVGRKLTVTVDSFPGERFAAHVSFVARAAEFTPGNVQTPEERSKQVFRIKVTLDEGLDRLRPGMAADVWLEEGT